MRFDDRLLTVLNQPAGDRHDAAVRWRQLVDLVARAGQGAASPVVAQALDSIRAESKDVDDHLRAAAARAVAALPLPPGLLEYFAADTLAVSAPVLAAAKLDPAQWRALLGVADDETRRFIETLHPEIMAAGADLTDALVEHPEPEVAAPEAPPVPVYSDLPVSPSLHDVVARIERRRRSRAVPGVPAPTVAAAMGATSLFRWECDPSGEIVWVEGAPRGALIGRSIARPHEIEGDRLGGDVVRAFAMRAPFRDSELTISGDGLASGNWKISGVPAFEPADGRFAGYRGVALRDVPADAPADAPLDTGPDPDSLRELVHEIKTPLTAIIGFAQIIDGQYLGPADRRYRQRAGDIVDQAQLLLGAIDDLDFAAKVHSGGEGNRVDLADLLERTADSIKGLAIERQVQLEVPRPQRIAPAAVEPELADRLMYRLCTAIIETAQPGERLRLSVDESAGQCRFAIGRPALLRGVAERELFDPAMTARDEQVAAAAFALRLVRGLARVAGGELSASPAGFALLFPRA